MASIHNFLFLSDLHLSEGRDPKTGLLHRNEDFFHDHAFAQFVAYHVGLSRDETAVPYYNKPWKLIINGDIFDFLQVTSKPPEIDGFVTIDAIDDTGKPIQVRKKLSDNERKYGLGTTSAEIVWKLDRIAVGHPDFFQALGWFLAHHPENELILLRGNHDAETYWPAAQMRMRQLLTMAYADWQRRAARGDKQTPLPAYADLPATLTVVDIAKRVQFPAMFHYESNLLYVEHGCQYDPANAFTNFTDPRLPDKPELIELPEGSLFVRYFFNDVEQEHPFADNMKPISRYVFWLVRNAPSSLFSFVWVLLPSYVRAKREISEKTNHRSHAHAQQAVNAFEEELLAIQTDSQAGLHAASKQTTRRMALSVLFVAITAVLLLVGVRLLGIGAYLWTVAALLAAAAALFLSSYLFKSIDNLLANDFLFDSASKICNRLNRSQDIAFSSVRYHIFGHDHAANVRPISTEDDAHAPTFRQWYVNTGAWVPIFDDDNRLLRDDEQLTFCRIVPDNVADGRDVPELLQWAPQANMPIPVRLFP